jgi:hypothetical protein
MEVLLNILHSPIFRRFVISPLAVIGFYQIFRGVIAIVEKDLSEKDWMRGWVVIVYVGITVLGCLCLIVAI